MAALRHNLKTAAGFTKRQEQLVQRGDENSSRNAKQHAVKQQTRFQQTQR